MQQTYPYYRQPYAIKTKPLSPQLASFFQIQCSRPSACDLASFCRKPGS
jgi:hypothetical protein